MLSEKGNSKISVQKILLIKCKSKKQPQTKSPKWWPPIATGERFPYILGTWEFCKNISDSYLIWLKVLEANSTNFLFENQIGIDDDDGGGVEFVSQDVSICRWLFQC